MSATYQPKVETNLRTRVTPNRVGYAGDMLEYQLQATDVEDAYTPAEIAEMEVMRDRLYELATKTIAYVEAKKAAPKQAASNGGKAKGKPKKAETLETKTLTVKELRALYQQTTGTPAPSKWNKKALMEAVAELAA